MIPLEMAGVPIHMTAAEAHYVPPGTGPRRGGWELTKTDKKDLEIKPDEPLAQCMEVIAPGKYFLRVTRVDFDTLTRKQNA